MLSLEDLAALVRQKNVVDGAIAALVGRPALIGHVGEFIASNVFDITLHESASKAGTDGHFLAEPLAGRSVNVKWYGKQEGLLDLALKATPDFYLVLTGPKSGAVSSRGGSRPWLIHFAFLFEAQPLHRSLEARGVKLGVATSVRASVWEAAEIYPTQRCTTLHLSAAQRDALALFR